MSWDPPPEEDNPGILVNYEVNYKTIGSENWLTEEVWSTEEPYVITGLEAFTSYTVSVTMVNLEGKGNAASVNVSTDEGGEFVYPQRSQAEPSYCCLDTILNIDNIIFFLFPMLLHVFGFPITTISYVTTLINT